MDNAAFLIADKPSGDVLVDPNLIEGLHECVNIEGEPGFEVGEIDDSSNIRQGLKFVRLDILKGGILELERRRRTARPVKRHHERTVFFADEEQ